MNNQEICTALILGSIGVTLSLLYLKKYYNPKKKSTIACFNEGSINKNNILDACNQIRAGENALGNDRETYLQLACRYNSIEAVKSFLPILSINDLKYLNIHGCNILHITGTISDNSDILQYIIDYIANKPGGGEKLLQELILTKTYDNQWTPLHLYSGKGFHHCIKIILDTCKKYNLELPINEKDEGGHTPLIMASANGFIECVKLLLNEPTCNMYLTNTRCKSCLFFASFNVLKDIVFLILQSEKERGEEYTKINSPENRKLVDISDFCGNSPLHAACLKGSLDLVKMLIDFGGNITLTSLSGDSTFHVCCQRNSEKHNEILRYLVNNCSTNDIETLINKQTTFGCTIIHDAAYCGNWKALEILHKSSSELFMKSLNSIDNDGLTPILSLCRGIITYKVKKFNIDALLKSLELILESGCNPNGGDFAKSTCLHFLCYGTPDDDNMIKAINILLEYKADPTIEDTFGWSPMHAIIQSGKGETSKQIYDILYKQTQIINPDYLKTFDKDKKRDLTNRTFVEKAGPHNQIPIGERKKVLNGDFTLKGIAKYIQDFQNNNDKPLKIVVLVGAGISVNCGIPDFRSPGSGIYSKINPGQFSLQFLASQPKEFYSLVNELFGGVIKGNIKPSNTHYFLKLLETKGLLQRIYTQNIDTIEKQVGISNDILVESHGSFDSARCISCMKPVENMQDNFWNPIFNSEIPVCSNCDTVVRPDVVFFGENLPSRFFELHQSDLKQADLLIVMGTSLLVYPFASLVNIVPLLTPRLLINKELTGPFTSKSSSNYRDAVFKGDCDDGVCELIELLGWTKEFNELKEEKN